MYDSWLSHIRIFIKGKKHGRMMLDLINNGPLVYPTVKENGQTRPKKYSELTEAQQLQDDCDIQATNIILHGFHPILYNLFDKFAYVQGETLKFVIDVKLAKSLYTTNYDQLYAYLSQHERHANEVLITCKRYLDPLALVANSPTLYNLSQSPQHLGEDPIECINKVMAFLSAVASRFPPSNNQLKTSSNPRNQATIQDGRVTVQQVQGRQSQSFTGIGNRGIATTSRGNYAASQPRVVKCYNSKAQEAGQILDEEKLAFLVDLGISEALVAHCDPDVLSEVPDSDSYLNDMINQDVQEMQYSEQTHIDDFQDNETHICRMLVLRGLGMDFSGIDSCVAWQASVWFAVWRRDTSVSRRYVSSYGDYEHTEVQTVFYQMEAAVDQCSVDKNAFEIQIKQLSIDNDQLLKQIMSQEIVHIAVNSVDSLDVKKSCVNDCNKCLELETELLKKKDLIEKDVYDKLLKSYSTLEKHCISLELTTQLNQEVFQKDNFRENQNAPTFNQLFELNELKSQSQEKDTIIRKLKDMIKSLSGKDSVENVKKDIDEIETINIELEHSMAKLLSENENLRKEREHLKSIYKDQFDSIRKTHVQSKEHYDSLIAQINAKSVENSDLNAQLQEKELLVYVSKTCPSLTKPCEKLVAVTPMNKDKKVRFAEPVTSSCNIPKQTDSLKIKYSNKPLLTSTGVKPTTSASRSKSSGDTKNNRIMRPPSSNQKNNVEDHSRKFKSSLNKMNSIFEHNSNALVKHSMRNAKFKSICAIYNKCLFDANHDMCIIDYVNDANVNSKSKSKRNKMRKVWKPTGKVFSEIRYSWKPIGRTFTIVGNKCPLTRITSTKVVPTKETSTKSVATPTQGILVYSRRPKVTRSVGSSSKVKIVESKTSNSKKPKQSWGSTVSDVLSSSLNYYRLSKLFYGIWTQDDPSI
ncbi:hypothetical protein Tco_1202465 [Tanacetum coccineum]